ncbi:TadE/TadG family type IV pilus assembly protein [Pectobacterium brasiliense]|uniref:TadE/TadG family type IV pilus assembly protein n=1 Tax=Pectobacterium brasiliense TaxID=180957 RepID=UPI000C1C2954|nr:TadE/TadG family type IV pilus assembly protein [Pectobacterium brasiliense]ATV44421.1 protein TadG, associated with Flp pilus assembly [Pectobacterium brasiliense]MBA0210505.1 pilus assembly protein [Pectobacterium brasiliense]MCA6982396.1 pilus assembly protein TadG-related protein [Pectobacterium brasiliense]MCH4991956.1 pilus assembly protein [Pectobacterium brasiliense]
MSLYSKLLMEGRRFYLDERGAFAVSFVIMAGMLLGIAAFAIDGPRYITERARLSDAMEQAALALTAEDNGEGAERNYILSSDYFRAYMRHDVAVFTPTVVVKGGFSKGNNYVEYRVSGQTLQDSWFSSSLFPSFDKQIVIGGNGAARKHRSNMDVIFVTDFSGSMNGQFGEGTKLGELKRIILMLSRELFQDNINNKVGFIPFGWGARKGGSCDFPLVTHRRMPGSILADGPTDEFENYINFPATVAAIPRQVKDINIPLSNVSSSVCLKESRSWRVPLTSNMDDIRQIEGMEANGFTLVSNGLLTAVPHLVSGTASRKILVVVSDGTDEPKNISITPKLMNAGMCEKIRRVLTTDEHVGKIAFVGIKYNPTYDWAKCVGKNNFYLSHDVHQLEVYLRRAVFEEVGRNILKD